MVAGFYPINNPIVTGIPIVNFFQTNGTWKKAYVSLKEDVNTPSFLGSDFRMFFNARSQKDVESTILLDNIKLIHF